MRGLPLKNPVRLSNRQQPAKPSISRAVLGVAEEIGRAVHEGQAAADDQLHVQFAGGKVGAHGAGKRVAVGDGDGGKAEFGGADGEFVRMRGSFQKGEVRRHLQFGVARGARHGPSPFRCGCLNRRSGAYPGLFRCSTRVWKDLG